MSDDESRPPDDHPALRHTRPTKQLPRIEDVMRRPFLTIPDIAVLLGTSPDGVRKMMTLGTVVEPLGKRGRRWFWDRDAVLAWMRGDDPGNWTPPPYRPRSSDGAR